jgi:hypothetical protein
VADVDEKEDEQIACSDAILLTFRIGFPFRIRQAGTTEKA